MTPATFLSYWTGLAFVAPELPWPTLVGTGLAMHICDAIMCRLFARNTRALNTNMATAEPSML